MPKRSNEFQRLVLAVKQHVAPDATVTESKFLVDRLTGAKREVDICIETTVAEERLIISLECRDHKRRVAVSWVEEMHSKHSRLETNALVLVSRSGLTPEAEKVAKRYGIRTMRYSEASSPKLGTLLLGTDTLKRKTWSFNPSKVVAHVDAIRELDAENVVLHPGTSVFGADGTFLGIMRDAVMGLLRTPYVVEHIAREAESEHKGFSLTVETGAPEQPDIYLEKLEPKVLRRIERLTITGGITVEIGDIPIARGTLGSTDIAWGSLQIFGREATLVSTKADDQTERVTLTVHATPEKKKRTRRRT